ncbi:MAG: TraR/DksA C4-type zinc finger protein [Candidatus Freyarchaeota archaeon]|nr:TraR/DksA C4-type zinc finger protein [Candidatus Jordarchaeia archaeon]
MPCFLDVLAEAERFHGHLCPGLIIGVMMGLAALKLLKSSRSKDEEVVAIVENDSCAVDGIQVVVGASLGKGNLYIEKYGKMAATFYSRETGEAYRLLLTEDGGSKLFSALSEAGFFSQDEGARRKTLEVLEKISGDELFKVQRVVVKAPPQAQIRKSVVCDECGEPTMETLTLEINGKHLCIPCATKKRYYEPLQDP